MAKKYYFVDGYSMEEIKSMGNLRNDAQIIETSGNPVIILRLNEIEAANAKAELKIFNKEHKTNIQLVG